MKNITAHPDGWIVQVKRNGIMYRAFFAYGAGKTAALFRAVAERERFYELYGRYVTGHRPRSNTGISGISELTTWSHNVPRNCFSVTYQRGAVDMKRFFYKSAAERPFALRAAIAYRARLAGEDAARLLAQAQEALCV